MRKRITDEEVMREIEELRQDEDVKAAQKALQKCTDKDRKRLYQLRWLKKKGQKLRTDVAATV